MPVFVLATLFLLASCSKFPGESGEAAKPGPDFGFLSVSDGRVHTLHALRYSVSVSGDFEITEPENRVDHFNNVPYRISLAAFVSDDRALMLHAEEVADSSGASDYGHLPAATWPNDTFRSGGPVCLQIPAAEVEGEHDLSWLRQNGFEPSGSLLYAQYFATTADMNTELVISLLQQVASCDEASAGPDLVAEFQDMTSVVRIE